MCEEMLTARDLTFFYPGNSEPALKNVNLSVKKGEFIGITGPTGAGKSTLSLCFTGIIPHFEVGRMGGKVYVGKVPIADLPAAELAKRIGCVLQDPEAQLVCMTVEDEIAFGMENLGFPRQDMEARITRSLEMIGISDLRFRLTSALSGGQKQRVVLAAVLALTPEVLVLDEPTSELDPLGTEAVFRILARLNRDYGITIILIEQKVDQLADYLNRLLVLSQGELIADGRPAEVLARPEVLALGVKVPQVAEFALLCDDQLQTVPVNIEEGLAFVRQLLEGGNSDGECA